MLRSIFDAKNDFFSKKSQKKTKNVPIVVSILKISMHATVRRFAYFFKIDHTIGEEMSAFKIPEKKYGFRQFFFKTSKN